MIDLNIVRSIESRYAVKDRIAVPKVERVEPAKENDNNRRDNRSCNSYKGRIIDVYA